MTIETIADLARVHGARPNALAIAEGDRKLT